MKAPQWLLQRWAALRSWSKRCVKVLRNEGEIKSFSSRKEHLTFYRIRTFAACQVLLPLSAFCFCYAIGQSKAFPEVKPFPHVPFISSVISHQPQSGIATIIVDIAAFMFLVILITRYLQVKAYRRPELQRLNKISLLFGVVAAFTILWIPAFDVLIQFEIHIIGTSCFFFCTSIYFLLYAYIAKKTSKPNQQLLPNIQVGLVIMLWMSVVITGTFLLPSLHRYNEAGYSIGPIAEWIWFSLVALTSCTTVIDFKNVNLTVTVESIPIGLGNKQDSNANVFGNHELVVEQESNATTVTVIDIDDLESIRANFNP